MTAERVRAPQVTVEPLGYQSERLRIEREHDAANPEFKHVWVTVDTDKRALSRMNAEVVRDGSGDVISDGLQMLCRVPMAAWNARRDAPAERSLARMKEISRNFDGSIAVPGELKKFRNPKARQSGTRGGV